MLICLLFVVFEGMSGKNLAIADVTDDRSIFCDTDKSEAVGLGSDNLSLYTYMVVELILCI